jgi:hypothetical protein
MERQHHGLIALLTALCWWPFATTVPSDTALKNFSASLSALSAQLQTTPPKQTDAGDEGLDLGDLGSLGTVTTTETITPGTEASVTLDFPVIGSLELKSFKRGTGVVLQAKFPVAGKKLDLGIATLDDGVFEWAGKTISLTGHMTFFNFFQNEGIAPLEARFGIREIEFFQNLGTRKKGEAFIKRCVIGVKFTKGNKLELIPGAPLSFDSVDLEFRAADPTRKEGQAIGIKITGTIFNQRVSLAGLVDGTKLKAAKTAQDRFNAVRLEGKIEKRKLTEFIPQLAAVLTQTPFENLSLEGLLFLNSRDGLVISGGLIGQDGKNAAISWNGIELVETKARLSTKEKRAYIYGKSDLLGLPIIGEFGIGWTKDSGGIGFRIYLDKELKEWRPFESAKIQEQLKLLQPAVITELKKIVIKEPQAEVEAAYRSSSQATIETKNKSTSTPTSATSSASPAEGFVCNAFISGKSTLFGFDGELILKVKIDPKSGTPAATVVFSLPDGFTFSKMLSGLGIEVPKPHKPQNPEDLLIGALDLIKLQSTKFVISTTKEKLGDWSVEPGINCHGGVTLSGDIKKNPVLFFLREVLKKTEGAEGSDLISVMFDFVFDPANPRGLIARGSLGPGDYELVLPGVKDEKELDQNISPEKRKYRQSYVFKKASMSLLFTGEPSIGFGGFFTMTPPGQDDPLKFGLDMLFTPLGFKITGGMKGEWFDPLGLPMLSIGNVGVNIGQTWEALQAAVAAVGTMGVSLIDLLIPGQLGLAGCVTIGKNPDQLKCTDPQAAKKNRDNPKLMSSEIAINVGKDVSTLAFLLDVKNPLSLMYTVDDLIDIVNARIEQNFLPPGIKIPRLPKISTDLGDIIAKNLPVLRHARIKFAPLGANIWEVKIPPGIGGALYFDLPGNIKAAQAKGPAAIAQQQAPPLKKLETKALQFARPGEEQWNVQVAPAVMGSPTPVPEEQKTAAQEADPCGVAGGVCGTSDICGELNIGLDGLIIKGKIPQISIPGIVPELPIFKITSADGKGDPCINITLAPNNDQAFVINGRVEILGLLNSATLIKLNKKGFAFDCETSLGKEPNVIKEHVYVTALDFNLQNLKNLDPAKIELRIVYSDTLTQKIFDDISATIANEREKFAREINEAIEQVRRDTSSSDITKATADADNICHNCCEVFEWWKRPFIGCCWDCVAKRIKVEALKSKKWFEGTDLGRWLKDAAKKLGLDKLAEDVLKIVGDITDNTLKTAGDINKKIRDLFVIHSVESKLSLKDFVEGRTGGVTIVATICGQTICRTYAKFNVRDPIGTIQTISTELNQIVTDAIKAAFGTAIAKTFGGCTVPSTEILLGKLSAPKTPGAAAPVSTTAAGSHPGGQVH